MHVPVNIKLGTNEHFVKKEEYNEEISSYCNIKYIDTCMSGSIGGVWIGNWIYWSLTESNYKQL
jgi:hypothetical protein